MDYLETFLQKHRKPILIILSLFIISVIVYNVITQISRIGKLQVVVKYAPFSATVKINGIEYQNNKTYYFSPGDYKVEASLEHFDSVTNNFTVEQNSVNNFFIGELTPSDDEGKNIMEQHNNDYLQVEVYGGIQANAVGEAEIDKDPIIQFLPINYPSYSVSYLYNEEQEFFVELVLKDGLDQIPSAIGALYSINKDINPASYKIIVRDYKNPFNNFKQNNQTNIVSFLENGYGSSFTQNYQILSDRIVSQGNYYGVLIIPKGIDINNDEISYPIYRTILEKDNNSWKLINEPYPIVSQYNAPEVPTDFLNLLNCTFVSEDI